MLRLMRHWLQPLQAPRSPRRRKFVRPGPETLEQRILLTASTTVADPLPQFDNIVYVQSRASFPLTPGFTIGVGNPANPSQYEHMLVTGFHDNFSNGFVVIRGADSTHDISHDFGEEVDLLPHTPETLLWTGNGNNTNWSNPKNWFVQGSGQVDTTGIAPQAGDSLVFGTAAVKSSINDLSGLSLNTITFQQPGYTISGNGIKLSGGVTDSATAGSPAVNDVVAFSNITLFGTNQFQVTGNLPLQINSSLLGAGNLVVSAGTSTVLLNGGGNYSGGTDLKTGTLRFTYSNSMGTGALKVEQGTTLSDGTNLALTVDNVLEPVGAVTFDLGGLLQFSQGASVSAASTITVIGGTPEFDTSLSGAGGLTLVAKPKTSTTVVGFNIVANDSIKVNLQTFATTNTPFTLEGNLTSTATVTVGPKFIVYLGHRASDPAGTGGGLFGAGSLTCTQDSVYTGPSISGFTGAINLFNCGTSIAGTSTDSALGLGGLGLSGGTLVISGTSTVLRNSVALAGTSFTISFVKAGALQLTGPVNVVTAGALNVNTSASNLSQIQFLGAVHGAQLTLQQSAGNFLVNMQAGLGCHLVDNAYYLNLAGPLSGILDVGAKAYAKLAGANAGSKVLTGKGSINVSGILDSEGSQPQFAGTITVKTGGVVYVASAITDVLGTGALVLDGGTLGCTDPTDVVTLVNNITLAGNVTLYNFDGLTLTGTVNVLPNNTLILDAGTLEFLGALIGTSTLVLDENPANGATSTDVVMDDTDKVGIIFNATAPAASIAAPAEANIRAQTSAHGGRTLTLDSKFTGTAPIVCNGLTVTTNENLVFGGTLTFDDCTVNVQTDAAADKILRSPLGSGKLVFNETVLNEGGATTIFGNDMTLEGSLTFATVQPGADLQFTGSITVTTVDLYLQNTYVDSLGTTPALAEFTKSLTGTMLTLHPFVGTATDPTGSPVYVNLQCSTLNTHLVDYVSYLDLGDTLAGTFDILPGSKVQIDSALINLGVKVTSLDLASTGTINVMGTLESLSNASNVAGIINLKAGGQITLGGTVSAQSPPKFLGTATLNLYGGTISCSGASGVADVIANSVAIAGAVTISGLSSTSSLSFSDQVDVPSSSTIYLKSGTLKFSAITPFEGSGKIKFIGLPGAKVMVHGYGGILPPQVDPNSSIPVTTFT